MVKIGREEPVVSMDNSGKVIWSKHNEIQTVNIKSMGADYEVWIWLFNKNNKKYLFLGSLFFVEIEFMAFFSLRFLMESGCL